MDIELLSKMVGELVLENDQVGLPGVGTFVAELVPATFSDKGYTINPPYRRLSFTSARLEENLLVDFYAQHNPDIDKVKAKAYLLAFLTELKSVLEERKTVSMPGLGRLRATRQNAFFFVPNEDLDIYPDGFGLESVSLKTHQETEEELSIAVGDLASILGQIPSDEEPASEPVPADPVPAEPEPEVAETEPVPAEPEPEPESAEPEPAPESAGPAPAATPAQEERHHQHHHPEHHHRSHHHHHHHHHRRTMKWWHWLLIALGAAILLLVAFLILARVAPDFIDSILYTEEELRIINYSIIDF